MPNISVGVDETLTVAIPGGTVLDGGPGGYVLLSGVFAVSDTVVTDGGSEIVEGSGTADDTLVTAGGVVAVFSGGTTNHTVVDSSGREIVELGKAIDTTVSSGGWQWVGSGGTAIDTVVSNGGMEGVDAGGIASGVTVESGGGLYLILASAYTWSATGDNVIGGVRLLSGTHVELEVYQGASITGLVVSEGGCRVDVADGGSTVHTTMYGDTGEYVDSGGFAVGTTLYTGAVEYVDSGGSANGTVVGLDAALEIDSGGVAIDTELEAGGYIILEWPHFPGGGSAVLNPTTDMLTVFAGSETVALQLSGDYTDDSFVVENDGVGPVRISLLPHPELFTSGADTVDFNNLTTGQQAAIAGGADIYHGLGGNDVVTLPNEANYNESVANGRTLGWTDTSTSTFYTGSQVGDTYTVNGEDGDYYIVEGAGTESITIGGNGSSIITAGSGSDTIAIVGNGANTVTGSDGDYSISLGDGNNSVTVGNGADTITVGNGDDAVSVGNGNDAITVGSPGNGSGTEGTVTVGTGTDTISINGEANYTINPSVGADTISLAGNGDNTINAGAGTEAIVITGDGDNEIDGDAAASELSLGTDGNLDIADGLEVTGAITGTGTVTIEDGATLEVGDVGAGVTVDFAGTSGTLKIDNLIGFGGQIDDFATGDDIIIPQISLSADWELNGVSLNVTGTSRGTADNSVAASLAIPVVGTVDAKADFSLIPLSLSDIDITFTPQKPERIGKTWLFLDSLEGKVGNIGVHAAGPINISGTFGFSVLPDNKVFVPATFDVTGTYVPGRPFQAAVDGKLIVFGNNDLGTFTGTATFGLSPFVLVLRGGLSLFNGAVDANSLITISQNRLFVTAQGTRQVPSTISLAGLTVALPPWIAGETLSNASVQVSVTFGAPLSEDYMMLSGSVGSLSGELWVGFDGTVRSSRIGLDGNGATTTSVVVASGDKFSVGAGATATSTVIETGGTETIGSGGADDGTLLDGGIQIVEGIATGAVLDGDATQRIDAGGVAIGTTIGATDTQVVRTGGTADNTIVQAGGTEVVESGGIASGTIIEGGFQVVRGGGTAVGSTINGGTLDLKAGAVTSGSIEFAGSGGTLEIDGTTMPTAVISGFGAGDAIYLRGVGLHSGGAITLDSNALQIADGGLTYQPAVAGASTLSGDTLLLAAGGSGGTVLTDLAGPAGGIALAAGRDEAVYLGVNDTVTGGAHADIFGANGVVIGGGTGDTITLTGVTNAGFEELGSEIADTIVGFSESAGDYLSFAGETSTSEQQVVVAAKIHDGNTILTFPDQSKITLAGVAHVAIGIFG